jgi:hypothetical protein
MAEMPPLTPETVAQMARQAAGIELSPEELAQLTPQLDRLLRDLAAIPEEDLRDLEPPLWFSAGEPEGAG